MYAHFMLTARAKKRSKTTMIIMIIVGSAEVIIFCIDILPLAFFILKIFSFLPYFGVFSRPIDISGAILLICGPPREIKMIFSSA